MDTSASASRISRKRAWEKTDKGRAYERSRSARRRSTPEHKAYLKQYSQRPESKAKARERDRKYRESARGKASREAWHKAKNETDGPDYYRTIKRRYADSDRGRVVGRDKQRRRRSRIVSSPQDLKVIADWETAWRSKRSVVCYWCHGVFSPTKCHVDHIVAVALGGTHTIDNLCIACAQCNWKKNDKPITEWNKSLVQMVLI